MPCMVFRKKNAALFIALQLFSGRAWEAGEGLPAQCSHPSCQCAFLPPASCFLVIPRSQLGEYHHGRKSSRGLETGSLREGADVGSQFQTEAFPSHAAEKSGRRSEAPSALLELTRGRVGGWTGYSYMNNGGTTRVLSCRFACNFVCRCLEDNFLSVLHWNSILVPSPR